MKPKSVVYILGSSKPDTLDFSLDKFRLGGEDSMPAIVPAGELDVVGKLVMVVAGPT